MRTDLTIVADKEYEEQLVNESDVQCVPCFGDTIIIGNNKYKVIERMFQYHPELKNIRVCDCWIRVELMED